MAEAINARGEIVGGAAVTAIDPNTGFPYYHAFLYSGGQMVDLGTLGAIPSSGATAINNQGQIVGDIQATDNISHGFLYNHGKMRDLNNLIAPNSGWLIFAATGINDHGQISAWGYQSTTGLPTGPEHALLLTPLASP